MSRNKQEHYEQVELMRWVEYNINKYSELELLYAIPNGGSRNIIEATNLKKEGVKAGIPDLCLPVSKGVYSSLYIEMKSEKGILSESQKDVILKLHKFGNAVRVCRNWEDARNVIMDYLSLNKNEEFATDRCVIFELCGGEK